MFMSTVIKGLFHSITFDILLNYILHFECKYEDVFVMTYAQLYKPLHVLT